MSAADPERALSRDQVREVDRLAMEQLGIPGLLLMEDAGLGATLALLQRFTPARGARAPIQVLCGAGNNGGDGWVVARQLLCRGYAVRVVELAPSERLPADAALQRRLALSCGVPAIALGDLDPLRDLPAGLRAAPLVVDALLGTGFRGEVREPLASVLLLVREAQEATGVPVVALDLPSGLDADDGSAAAVCIRADLTVTFVAPKTGFATPGARQYTGEVVVVPLGTPPDLTERVRGEHG
jgi:NAD(P)H-hydrate epimerase